ncbi:hypothetical protein SO802_031735 [Lithocarpus litseifolius]|uniref:RNase H type-1 domain-containing protein n=1 Tax=Lithocarpus litseifolius TaxID=425828 RepID=A0AAW2BLB7_9ROSI
MELLAVAKVDMLIDTSNRKEHRSGIGVVIHDSYGSVMASLSKQLPRVHIPLEIEALAGSTTLWFASGLCFTQAVLEGDCQIFNLYSVKNLTNLSRPRTIFLFYLFTHKEIDICNHIYHLFIKCITKRNSRLTLPFPSLVMSLILRAMVKNLSGLQVMQKEDPISEQTFIRSKAHIPGPTVGVSQIPRDDANEGGDTKEEIKHFTSVPEDIVQPSSQARPRAPD